MRQRIKSVLTMMGAGSLVSKTVWLRKAYNHAVSIVIQSVGVCLPTDEHKVIFVSYEGGKYDDSPKSMSDYIRENHDQIKIVWAFSDPSVVETPSGIKKVKIYTINFLFELLTSKYIVSNALFFPSVYFKSKNSYYMNTWHGSAIKKIGKRRDPLNKNFTPLGKQIIDLLLAQSEHDVRVFSESFSVPQKNILISGLPRNDALTLGVSASKIKYLRDRIGVPSGKKVILYAPTYRNYVLNEDGKYIAKNPVNFVEWEEQLGHDYIVLYRSHYFIDKVETDVSGGRFVIDVSGYKSVNDLLLVSDALISDYSSMVFDYSILGRPIILYLYDYKEYERKVGFELDIKNESPGPVVFTETDLLQKIASLESWYDVNSINEFRSKYVLKSGESTKEAVEALLLLP